MTATIWACVPVSARPPSCSPTSRAARPAPASTAAIHSAQSWSAGLKSMTISGGLASGVLENLRQVRSRSHSCRGGSGVMHAR